MRALRCIAFANNENNIDTIHFDLKILNIEHQLQIQYIIPKLIPVSMDSNRLHIKE